MSEIRITEAAVPKGEKEDTPEKLAALDRLLELQALAEDGLLCTYEKESTFTFEQVCRLMAEIGLGIESEWREWGVVEIAVRNPQVAEYCKHWERRAESAESRLRKLTPPVELKRYGWDEVPQLCPECDSKDFISSGPKHFVCLHCWDAQTIVGLEDKLTDHGRVCDALAAAEKELAEMGLKLRETAQQVLHLGTARFMLIEERTELQQKLTALSAILKPLKVLHEECQPDGDRSPADVYYARVILRDRLFDALPELLRVMEGAK